MQKWLTANEVTIPALAERCAEEGHPISAAHLRFILKGKRRPIWELAKFLAETMGDGTTPQDFMEFSSPSGEKAA